MNYDLPEIEGIDWEVAHHYVPSPEALHETLVEIVKSAAKKVAELRSYRDAVASDPSDENFASYRICAHAMKSALRSIGADAFSEAYELECAGQNRDESVVMEKTDLFTENYMALATKLKAITGDVDVAAKYDESIFYEQIDAIEKAMEAFDINALQDALGVIMDMDTPPEFADELGRLEEAIVYLDPDQVMASCAIFKGGRP